MSAVLHISAIAVSMLCLVASLLTSRHRSKLALWGDAVMVIAMAAAVITEQASVAIAGAVLLVITAVVEALAMRRSRVLSDASRANILHRLLCFIAMAFLLVAMQHQPATSAVSSGSHAHGGIFMPALLALTGIALLMAVILGTRQLRLLAATGARGSAITHYVIEAGGMVTATALMLAAVLVGH